jgi:sulfate adenylyltransferase subunit 1 (EFTu-like GTPase family)
MIAFVAIALVPSAARGGGSLMIRSSAEAWESSQRLIEYLEGLKNAKADREGTPFSFCYFNPPILLVDL